MKWWNTSQVDILSQLSLPFLGTWQTSGMMRNGQVFALPMQERLTTDSEFSSLPTPTTQDSSGVCRDHGGDLLHDVTCGCSRASRRELMRTPAASEAERGHQPEDKSKARGGQVTLSGQMMTYFPTPKALDGVKGSLKTSAQREADGRQIDLPNIARDLMPTPTAVDGNTVAKSELDNDDPKHRLKVAAQVLARDGISWGKFEPAIRRWEETLGRPAPAPTQPDGKEGAHRLSAAFTEWMMGVPAGWIIDVGLTRNEELKACGNGVVPQQAELALRVLLEGITLPRGGGQVNLPTPTVSDTFTDNLESSQQKPGSMHSVTLPQAVKWVQSE
jgi:hypothetical protein